MMLDKEKRVLYMRTKDLVLMALFIVLEVISTRFLSLEFATLRIGFTFIAYALAGLFYGPLRGGLMAAAADIIGIVLWPKGGVYFVGFTISAFLQGASFGFLKSEGSIDKRLIAILLFETIGVSLILNTYWLHIMYDKAWILFIGPRIVKEAVLIVIRFTVIRSVVIPLYNRIKEERLLV